MMLIMMRSVFGVFANKNCPGPEVIKLFSCITQLSMEFIFHANKSKITNNAKYYLAKHS